MREKTRFVLRESSWTLMISGIMVLGLLVYFLQSVFAGAEIFSAELFVLLCAVIVVLFVLQWYGINQQKTLIERIQKQSKMEKIRVETILANINESAVVQDESGKILLVNQAAANFFESTAASLVGRSVFEVVSVTDATGKKIGKEERPFQIVLRTKKIVTSRMNQFFYEKKDKTRISIVITAAPVIFDKKIVGVVSIFRDISHEKEVDYLTTQFISLAAHQLRTPLTVTKWALETLENGKNLNDVQKKRLNQLRESNERVIHVVNDLLNVSRFGKQKVSPQKEKVDIVGLLKQMTEAFKKDAAERKQKIVLKTSPSRAIAHIDPMLFEQTINCFLNNAIAYGGNQATITVFITENSKEYRVSVNNSGSFIAPSERDKIFTKFYRTTTSQKMMPNGSGLGLFLAKSSAEANGGKIGFESSVKEGTTFFVTVLKK